MTDYRRIHMPNATWFFTVTLAERHNNHLLAEKINSLRAAFHYAKKLRPFHINTVEPWAHFISKCVIQRINF